MTYKVKFDKKAFKEWEALTDSLRKQFAKVLKKKTGTTQNTSGKIIRISRLL